MGVDVVIEERFGGGPTGRRGKGRREGRTPAVDTLHPYDEVLFDFLLSDPVVGRLPVLSRWDPVGRIHWLQGEDLEAVISEVEEARAGAQAHSDTALMLGKLSWLARRALAEDLVLGVFPD